MTEISRQAMQEIRMERMWLQKKYPSKHHPGVEYTTTLNRDGSGECDCPRFRFKRTCSHIEDMKNFAKNLSVNQ